MIVILVLASLFAIDHDRASPVSYPAYVDVETLALVNSAGEEVKEVAVGAQVSAQVSVSNRLDSDQPFVILLEIRDGYGITQMLSWQSGIIKAGGNYTFGASWVPADDCLLDNDGCSTNYQLRTFAVSSLIDPMVLSIVVSKEGIRVDGSPTYPPLDQHQFQFQLDDGRTYEIDYSFSEGNGGIVSINDEHETDRMRVLLQTPTDARFTLTIPKFLIEYSLGNSEMFPYEIHAFIDGMEATPDVLSDNGGLDYVFVFSVEQGMHQIVLEGQSP